MIALTRWSLLAAAVAVSAQSNGGCDSNTLEVSYPAPVAADGWSYRLVAQNMTKPRSIAFDSEGGLIVLDSGVGILHFSLEDNGGTCVSVGKKTTLVEAVDLNHGLALSEDGRTIYASTEENVFSWAYNASSPRALSNPRTLVTNMTNPDGLSTRTLLLSRSQPGMLLVSRGSDSDDDPIAEELDSGRSQIRSFNLTRLENDADADAYEFLDGDVWGWGLRNSVGMAEDPVYGGIWSVENSVDELRRHGKDIHNNNPAEELNFHGYANGTAGGPLKTVGEDNNYGYPYCFAVWSTDIPDPDGVHVADQIPDEITTDVNDDVCMNDYVAPMLAFQAHSAPLDIKFNKDGSELIISFHGSWNRENPVGYKLATIAFGDDGMPSSSSTSRDAATDIIKNPNMANCPDECFRPVGVAWDSSDRLWFASDWTGEIFVMERSSSGSGSGSNGDGNADENNDDDGDGDDEGASSRLLQPHAAVAIFAVALTLLLA